MVTILAGLVVFPTAPTRFKMMMDILFETHKSMIEPDSERRR